MDITIFARQQLKTALDRATSHPPQYYNQDVALGTSIREAVEARRSVDWPRGVHALLACNFGATQGVTVPCRSRQNYNGKSIKSLHICRPIRFICLLQHSEQVYA